MVIRRAVSYTVSIDSAHQEAKIIEMLLPRGLFDSTGTGSMGSTRLKSVVRYSCNSVSIDSARQQEIRALVWLAGSMGSTNRARSSAGLNSPPATFGPWCFTSSNVRGLGDSTSSNVRALVTSTSNKSTVGLLRGCGVNWKQIQDQDQLVTSALIQRPILSRLSVSTWIKSERQQTNSCTSSQNSLRKSQETLCDPLVKPLVS